MEMTIGVYEYECLKESLEEKETLLKESLEREQVLKETIDKINEDNKREVTIYTHSVVTDKLCVANRENLRLIIVRFLDEVEKEFRKGRTWSSLKNDFGANVLDNLIKNIKSTEKTTSEPIIYKTKCIGVEEYKLEVEQELRKEFGKKLIQAEEVVEKHEDVLKKNSYLLKDIERLKEEYLRLEKRREETLSRITEILTKGLDRICKTVNCIKFDKKLITVIETDIRNLRIDLDNYIKRKM